MHIIYSISLRLGRKYNYILLIFILNGNFLKVVCQPLNKIRKALNESGFENTRAVITEGNCFVSIENHTYRWDVMAFAKGLELLSVNTEYSVNISLVVLENGIPQELIIVNRTDWKQFALGLIQEQGFAGKIQVSNKTESVWKLIRKSKLNKPSTFKFDFVIYPQLFFENTRVDQLYEVQLNIAPALEYSLWKGNKFVMQAIFPIYNNLGYEGNTVRPGYLTIAQDFRLPGRWLGSVTAGNFNGGRYGSDLYIRHPFKNGRWNLELNTGLTGDSHFLDSRWIHNKMDILTWSGSLSWFYPRYDLELKAGAGRYIKQDYGVFASCSRSFGETIIGFYLKAGETSQNGGFFFSIPLFFKERPVRKTFRITIPSRYSLIYNAGTEHYFGQSYCADISYDRKSSLFFTESIKNKIVNHK